MDQSLKNELDGAAWRKPTKSGSNGDCFEVAPLSGGRVALRDTEAPEKDPFVVRASVWAALMDGAKRGEFDF